MEHEATDPKIGRGMRISTPFFVFFIFFICFSRRTEKEKK